MLFGGKPSSSKKTNTHSGIRERVYAIIAENLGVDESEINDDQSFVEDLGADSLDTVELVMSFEEEFETEIADEEAEKIQTVGQAIAYMRST